MLLTRPREEFDVPRPPLRKAALPLISGCLILAGCGSGQSAHTASTASTPICPAGEAACVSTSPSVSLSGPRDLATNLIELMKVSNPTLTQVKLACQPDQAKYPKVCRLDAKATSRGKTVTVAGTVTAFGVYTKTRTYAYSVNYAPAPG
ncbi:MAG TPA: hypothetical protein VG186_03260 [Solirubrobacteraceae bacterium]|jgi:hypothetical protein|nr:hypothetical protein [Solirubrobacteraceae bacterium]